MVPRGLEPRTLRLLAVRSDQLSYKSSCVHQIMDCGTSSAYCTKCARRAFYKITKMENLGIDPSASRMLSERSTI